MCMKIFLHTMSLPLQVIASQKQLEAKYKQAQATAVRGRPRRGRGLAWEGDLTQQVAGEGSTFQNTTTSMF